MACVTGECGRSLDTWAGSPHARVCGPSGVRQKLTWEEVHRGGKRIRLGARGHLTPESRVPEQSSKRLRISTETFQAHDGAFVKDRGIECILSHSLLARFITFNSLALGPGSVKGGPEGRWWWEQAPKASQKQATCMLSAHQRERQQGGQTWVMLQAPGGVLIVFRDENDEDKAADYLAEPCEGLR